ncbi:MAG TPA: enoyl-CoA hydratase-related protein [Caulobacteraceae bacterium]|nr:enoyl-CoA hydratase-related protein [Caulobacteraceae bacterium]
MSGYETILYEKAGHVARVTFNRPEARNGITPTLLAETFEAVQDAGADKALRVLVIAGAGRDFCPGADIKHYAGGRAERSDPKAFTISAILHETPVVSVAAIRGACAGAGLGWAAACDLRFCDDTAKFNSAFLDVGLSGDMGGPWLLPRIVGAAKARELYFLPGKFDAAEAHRIGLVSRVFSAQAFTAEMDAIVARLENAAPLALKAMKANFLDAERLGLAEFIALETERHTALGGSEDSREAFRAFVEKRRPVFQGR